VRVRAASTCLGPGQAAASARAALARVDLRCVESVQGEGAVHLRYEVA